VRTLAFLDPAHFHATLTLREAHPDVSPEIVVDAPAGPALDDFLALIERFNRRAERPTRWRPRVRRSSEPLAALLDERPGDVVVLAGRNRGKAAVIARLHAAGLHVLADKPWLVEPDDLGPIREALAGGPIAREMMTGRRDAVGRLVKRLVDEPELFGGFVPGDAGEPAIEHDGVHHFEKQVDGAPLRRPAWFFDSRVQGSGVVDIPTHLVDQAQWLAASPGPLRLRAARGWSTPVPLEVFNRVTGATEPPPELAGAVERGHLHVFCNAEILYALGDINARVASRWEAVTPPGGGDASRVTLRGRAALIGVEQSAATDFQRRVTVQARGDAARTGRALADALGRARAELPGVGARPVGSGGFELVLPPAPGHEAHFAELLDELLGWIAAGRPPDGLAADTLAKYTLLAEAAAATAHQSVRSPPRASRSSSAPAGSSPRGRARRPPRSRR
jgi:predicted dehydrogenase